MTDNQPVSQQPETEATQPAENTTQPAETPPGSVQTGQPEEFSQPEKFDWRGWLLVGVVVFSFLVMPGVILFLPQAQWLLSNLGLSWRQAYLVFPMIPAILLGITAVWAALRSQTPED